MGGLAKFVGIAGVFMALGLFAILTVGAGGNSAKVLFEARCSTCHDTDRPLGQTKTVDGWRETVTRMQEHAGGKISDEDTEIIIQYLGEIRGK